MHFKLKSKSLCFLAMLLFSVCQIVQAATVQVNCGYLGESTVNCYSTTTQVGFQVHLNPVRFYQHYCTEIDESNWGQCDHYESAPVAVTFANQTVEQRFYQYLASGPESPGLTGNMTYSCLNLENPDRRLCSFQLLEFTQTYDSETSIVGSSL